MASLLLVLVMVFVPAVLSFTCMPQHPQKAFCNSDFVITATIMRNSAPLGSAVSPAKPTFVQQTQIAMKLPVKPGPPVNDPSLFFQKIQVTVTKVFKGNDLLKASTGLEVTLLTSQISHLKLTEGTTYLIAGLLYNNQPMVTACNWVQEAGRLTLVERQGLKKHYAFNCGCDIKYCPPTATTCSMNGKPGCVWKPSWENIGLDKLDCKAKNFVCFNNEPCQQRRDARCVTHTQKCAWYTVPKLQCPIGLHGDPPRPPEKTM